MERTVLITGCSSGIGAATARRFHAEEWTVYATARDTDDIAALDELGCETQPLDVTDRAHCRRAVDRVLDEQGRLDCVVNNAGYGLLGPIEDVPTTEVKDQFDVNVYGPHRLARAALPHMRERGDGTIVNLSSTAGLMTAPGFGVYSGSKAALESMSDALRREVAPFGVDVALVEPGPVDTGFQSRAEEELERVRESGSGAYDDVYDFHTDRYALGNFGQSSPEAVADAAFEAASSPNPDPRYPVGASGRLVSFARHLPTRWVDSLMGLARRVTR